LRTGDRIGYNPGVRFSAPRNGNPEIQDDASWIIVEDEKLPHPVQVRIGVSEDGRLVATGLLIQVEAEGELTTRAARIPLAEIVTAYAAVTTETSKRLALERLGRPEFAKDKRWQNHLLEGPEDSVSVAARTQPVRRVRPGPHGYSDDYYRDVAKRYAQAKREHPQAPIQALMKEFPASEPTVHRWLRTAREKGFIKTTKKDKR
jgi:hypothetical protein